MISTPRGGAPLTVAVAYPGDPTDPRHWSGTPAGLVAGLRAADVDVRPVDLTPPAAVARVWTRAVAGRLRPSPEHLLGVTRQGAPYAQLVSAVARLRIPRDVHAVLQIGTGYRVEHPVVATFEDMTVAQARRHRWGPFASLPARVAEGRERLQRRAYEDAAVCFMATRWSARSVVEDYGIDPAKVCATGLGINRAAPAPSERNWQTPTFLFVGNDWARKNGEMVLRAFRAVRRLHPQARLHLVGHGIPGVQEPGVRVHGPMPMGDPAAQARLAALFGQSTCLVVPSRLEPAGIVYAEAASAGMPSIGSTVGGAADVIGGGGEVVDPEDAGALTAAMLRMADPAAARAAGERAQAHARTLTWAAVGEVVADRLRLEVSGTRAVVR